MTSAPLHIGADGPQPRALAAGMACAIDAGASDELLVKAAQAGERRAFDLLVARYHSAMIKLAMRYLRNVFDAEDAVQETFVAAYRGLRRFRGACAFHTWLHRIALNCAKNVLIARAREGRLVSLDGQGGGDGVEPHQYLHELETPESLALSADIRAVVHATLDALPEGHRTAIMLREIDGLSYQQIALAMHIPMGTVRSRVFRAREIIDQRLRAVHDGGLGRRTRSRAADLPHALTVSARLAAK